MVWSTEKRVTAGFVVTLIVLAAARTVSHWSLAHRDQTEQLAAHVQEVITGVGATLEALQEARVHYRDHLLSGEQQNLLDYRSARARVSRRVDGLRRLADHDPETAAQFERLVQLIESKLAALDAGVAAFDASAPPRADRAIVLGGADEMALIRATLAGIEADQKHALSVQISAARADARRSFHGAVVATALSTALLLAAYSLALRYVRYRDAAEERIQRLNRDLRHRADELQTLLEVAPVGLVVAQDPLCRVIRGNAAMARMLGVQPGSNLSNSAPADELPAYRCFSEDRLVKPEEMPMQVAAATGATVSAWEFEVVGPDGPVARLCGSAVPLLDQQGRPRGAVGAFWDVAHLRAQQERLREERDRALADSAGKDDLLAEVSHDLRTPLGATLLWGKLIKQGALGEPERSRAVDAIIESAEMQTRLIDDVLDAARISHGTLQVERHPVDLVAVVRAACTMIRPLVQDRDVILVVDLPEERQAVEGDEARLRRVFWNLLSNALKFTPAGGCVSVALDRAAGDLRVRVSDTGRGIAPDLLPHVFERFRQGDGPPHGTGLGLGLSIVQHVVQLHGGSVEAHSAGTGRGSTFTVTLPCAGSATELGSEDDPAELQPARSGAAEALAARGMQPA